MSIVSLGDIPSFASNYGDDGGDDFSTAATMWHSGVRDECDPDCCLNVQARSQFKKVGSDHPLQALTAAEVTLLTPLSTSPPTPATRTPGEGDCGEAGPLDAIIWHIPQGMVLPDIT